MIVKGPNAENKKGHVHIQWAIALTANMLSMCFGFESGWISPTTRILMSESSPTGAPLAKSTISWIASSMNMGAVLGVLAFAYVADRCGRKRSVILLAVPYATSWIIRLLYTSVPTLMVVRAIGGFAAGGTCTVMPMYVKEISQSDIRGTLGSLMILGQNVGIFLMFLMGVYLDYYTVMYVVVCVPIVAAAAMTRAPESPAYLIKLGNIKEATEVVALLRGRHVDDKEVQREIEYMKNEDDHFKSLPEISMASILKDKTWGYALLLVSVTVTCQATNGSISIFTYASAILSSTGVKFDISPELQSLIIPVVMIISSLSLTLFVERFGRKVIFTGASLVTVLSMSVLGTSVLVQQMGTDVPSWLPVLAMGVSVSMYAGSISPLPYIIMSEIFTFQIRAKIMGKIISYAWFVTFVTIFMFSPLSAAFGAHSVFYIYAAINLFGAVFVYTFLPETKGKSDEEIRQQLLGKKLDQVSP